MFDKIKEQAQRAAAKRAAQMQPRAQELAYQKAEEEGVSIDRICVIAAPTGHMKAVVMR